MRELSLSTSFSLKWGFIYETRESFCWRVKSKKLSLYSKFSLPSSWRETISHSPLMDKKSPNFLFESLVKQRDKKKKDRYKSHSPLLIWESPRFPKRIPSWTNETCTILSFENSQHPLWVPKKHPSLYASSLSKT